MKTFYIKTFGCQMNEHDSQKMGALLAREGYARADSPEKANLIVINTCSIREKSYQKAVSEVGLVYKKNRQGRNNQKPVVALTGCVASHDGKDLLKRFPFIDITLSPDHLMQLPQLVRDAEEKKVRINKTDFEDFSDYEFPAVLPQKEESFVKAYVTIMKGCDNVCSFCIVPFVRGKEVSRPSIDVIDEIYRLEERGVKEVMLLGQNVNSYGKSLPEKTNFAKLLHLIDQQTHIQRLRFITPHPKDLSAELIAEYGRNSKLCPQIHLPVQSGSNSVLKRMRRSYTREVYLRKVEALRKVIPDIAITSDIIVGFPGETDHDFEQTLHLVEEVGYDSSYSFVFSPRPGTEAEKFVDDVPLTIKKERLAQLQDIQASVSLKKNRGRIDKVEQVLVEGSAEKTGQMTGRTPHGRIINFIGDDSLVGAILDIEVTEASAYSLKGKLISKRISP